jgi:hypothetical protein
VVAMTHYGGILRITLDAGIVGRGHAKIADLGTFNALARL